MFLNLKLLYLLSSIANLNFNNYEKAQGETYLSNLLLDAFNLLTFVGSHC